MAKTEFTTEQAAQIEALLARMTLKKVKSHQTLDGGALRADFYLDGKLVDTFNDEGSGGGACPMNFDSEGGKAFLALIESDNLRQLIQVDYDFLTTEELTPDYIADWFVSEMFNRQQQAKAEAAAKKAAIRRQAKKLSWLSPKGEPMALTFKSGKSITELASTPKGLSVLQTQYDRISSELRQSEQKFTTPATLLAANNIVVDLSLHLE